MKLYLYHSPYFQIFSYKFLYKALLTRQIFSEQEYLNFLKLVQQRAQYQVQSGLKELRDQVNIPFKTIFNRRATRSIGKCLLLVHTCLSGQKIEDPLFKEQSQLLIKVLKSFCELINKIYFQLPNYNNNPKLIQPQIVFFNQIYLKYCMLGASHYNFTQCWEKLSMHQNLCQNFYKLVDKIQSRDKWLNKGFFWLRDMVLYEGKNIPNQLEIYQQYSLNRIKSKFKNFQICSKQFQVKPKAYNGNVSFYIFKKQNNEYQYIYRVQNVVEFRQNDNSQYKIVAIFQDVIGMDVIFIYQGGQIIQRCKIIQLDLQNICHEQIKTQINDDSMSQSEKQYQLQKLKKQQKNKEKKQSARKKRIMYKQIKKRKQELLAQLSQNSNNQTQNNQQKKGKNNKKQSKTTGIKKDKNNRKPKDQQKDKQ